MNITPYQQDVINAKICPYCKSTTRVTNEAEIYGRMYKNRSIIVCVNYPTCDAYVGTHGDGSPLGRLANKNLRDHKVQAHYWFDKIWKEGFMDRSELYAELSDFLKIPSEYTHIGMFSPATCIKTEQWAKQLYEDYEYLATHK